MSELRGHGMGDRGYGLSGRQEGRSDGSRLQEDDDEGYAPGESGREEERFQSERF